MTCAKLVLILAAIFLPELKHMHHTTARSYEECHFLFTNTDADLNYAFMWGIPAYSEALFNKYDMGLVYKEYKRTLQICCISVPLINLS
jgi:hypothetical protein